MKLPWYHPADDFISDRLVHLYSPVIFIAAAIFLGLNLNSGYRSNLYCNSPEHFTEEQNAFIHSSCWSKGKFYIDRGLPINDHRLEAQEYNFNVNRALPLILLFQTLVFLLPRLLWKWAGSFCACPMHDITRAADDLCTHRHADFSPIAGKVLTYLETPCHVFPAAWGAILRGYNLVLTYTLCKIGYIVATVVQMSILTAYLGFDFYGFRYGLHASEHYTYKETYAAYGVDGGGGGQKHDAIEQPFPHEVLCDVNMRVIGKLDAYTLQCDIAANTAIERCLFLLWAWLWFLFYLLVMSTIFWLLRIVYYHNAPLAGEYKTKRVLSLLAGYQNINFKTIDSKFRAAFIELVTQPDGLLILAMLESNVSMNAAAGLLRNMWMTTVADDIERSMRTDEEEKPLAPRLTSRPSKPQPL